MKTTNYCTRLLAFTLLASSVAQSINAQKLSIAPELGLVHSLYRPVDKTISVDGSSMMYNFGANFILSPTSKWTASAGLFCVANNISVVNEDDSKTGSVSMFRFQHLQLPVHIGYKKKVGYGSFWLQGGVNVGYSLRAEKERWVRKEPMGEEVVSIEKSKIYGLENGNMKKFDIGLNASLSYVMPFGLFGKMQYHHGLNRAELHSVGQIRRQFLSFNVGYIFKMK